MIAARGAATRCDAGQALTECLIGCLLLVPLWWFMQHWIAGQSHRASLQSQVRVAALAESLAVGQSAAPGFHGDVDVQVARRETPALAGTVEQAGLALLAPLQALAPGRLDLRRDGWIRAEVSVDAPEHPFWRNGPQRWREPLALLVDDWSLDGPAAVERRTQTLLPATPIEWVFAALDTVQAAVYVLEPALRGSCARRIDPEVVPEDRISAGAQPAAPVRAASGWRPRC